MTVDIKFPVEWFLPDYHEGPFYADFLSHAVSQPIKFEETGYVEGMGYGFLFEIGEDEEDIE